MEPIYFNAENPQTEQCFTSITKEFLGRQMNSMPAHEDCSKTGKHPLIVIKASSKQVLTRLPFFFPLPLPELFAQKEYIKAMLAKRSKQIQQQRIREQKKRNAKQHQLSKTCKKRIV